MCIDAAVEWGKIPSQHIAHQLLAANGAAGSTNQRRQKIELDGGEIYRRALPPDVASSCIQLDISPGDGRRDGPLRCRSSQYRSDARDQLSGIKRLRQIIVRTHLKTANA